MLALVSMTRTRVQRSQLEGGKSQTRGRGEKENWGVIEWPKVEYMKDKRGKGEGREDDGEWLIIDLFNDNGVFSFFFSHRDVTSRVEANHSNNSILVSMCS